MRILLTDGLLRKTLSVARSLGKLGHEIIIAEKTKCNTSAFSKYCMKSLHSPDAVLNKAQYLKWLNECIVDHKIDFLIPMDDAVMTICVENREALSKLTLLFIPDQTAYELANNKANAVKVVQSCGITTPKTWEFQSLDEFTDFLALEETRLPFPLVIKPRKSSGSRGIVVVHNLDELLKKYKAISNNYELPMIQEFLKQGPRYDVCLLYSDAHEVLASFVQKELRHFPEPMGPSTVQMSLKNDELLGYAIRIMEKIPWKGIVELEFIQDPDTQVLYFMEINTRFWASIQCAIHAGVDFPSLYLDAAIKKNTYNIDYKEHLMTRWLYPSDILRKIVYGNRVKWEPPFLHRAKQGVYDDVFDVTDPWALFGFCLSVLRYILDVNMWKAIFWRSK